MKVRPPEPEFGATVSRPRDLVLNEIHSSGPPCRSARRTAAFRQLLV